MSRGWAGRALGPVLLASTRHLMLHPVLALLAVLGIALGVAMSSGIDLAIASSHRAFAASVVGVAGRATEQIIGGPSGIQDGEVARLRSALAPAAVAPVVASLVALRGRHGRCLYLIGIDPIAEAPFAAPGALARLDAGPGVVLMTRPGTIALARATAAELGVGVGSSLELVIGAHPATVEVAALLGGDGRDQRAFADLALCDISTAQELLGRLGRVDRVDLIVPPEVRPRLAQLALPPGASLATAGSQGQAMQSMTAAFDLNLTAMGLLALVVGVFLIFNTIDFLAVQRRELMARLRLHGATRGALAAAVLLEAGALGLAGSALGLVLGIGCAHLLVAGMTRTISDLWFQVTVREVALPPALLLANLGMGVAASLAAAVIPAIGAMRIQPAVGVLASLHAERSRRALPRLAGAGLAALLGSWALLAWGPASITAGFAVIAGCIAGSALLVPALLAWSLTVAARPLSRLAGPLTAIAARSAEATIARTGLAVAALAVACAASLGVEVMVGSFRAALVAWLDGTLREDVYISAPRAVAARINEVSLPDEVVTRLAAVPGVAHLLQSRNSHPEGPGGAIDLGAFDLPAESHAAFRFLEGDPSAAWPAFDQGAVLITEPFAAHQHLGAGDGLRLRTDQGWHRFRVAGVVRDYSSDQGTVLMAMPVYRRWWQDRGISALSVIAAPGVAADTLIARMRAAVPDALLQFESSSDLRRESLAVFDQTFAVTRTIRLLAGGVAFLGVLSALSAQALERRRELSILRMHGATPAQVGSVLAGQALLSGLAAGVLSVPLGLMLARLLVLVINRRSFGWSFDLVVAPAAPAFSIVLAVAAAVLACLHPCWRAGRISPAMALRTE